jgi:excisionase family DNA binding protein
MTILNPMKPMDSTEAGVFIGTIQASAEEYSFERLIPVDEAIQLIPVHRNTLLLWARKGKVPSIPIGRKVFFRASELNQWLRASCYAEPAVHAAQPERRVA